MYTLYTTCMLIVYFFWSIVYILLEARNISYDISKKLDWKCSNMFRLVERIPSPFCYSMRKVKSRSKVIIRSFVVAIRRLKFSRDVCSI